MKGRPGGFAPSAGPCSGGRVIWDLVSGTVCAGMGGYLALFEPDWRYRAMWGIFAAAGVWTLAKINSQLVQARRARNRISAQR